MLFNSFEFLVFFPIVALVYYILNGGGCPKTRWNSKQTN